MSELETAIANLAALKERRERAQQAFVLAERAFASADSEYSAGCLHFADLIKTSDEALQEAIEKMTSFATRSDVPSAIAAKDPIHPAAVRPTASHEGPSGSPRQRPIRSDSSAFRCIPVLRAAGREMEERELFDASGLADAPRKGGAPPNPVRAMKQMRRVLRDMAHSKDALTYQRRNGKNFYGLLEWEGAEQSAHTAAAETQTRLSSDQG